MHSPAPSPRRGTPPVPGVTWHAMDRAAQYYGEVSIAEWLNVMLDILERRSVISRRMPTGCEYHWVVIHRPQGDLHMQVVYRAAPDDAAIITVLPPDAKQLRITRNTKAGIKAQRLRPCEWKSTKIQCIAGRVR